MLGQTYAAVTSKHFLQLRSVILRLAITISISLCDTFFRSDRCDRWHLNVMLHVSGKFLIRNGDWQLIVVIISGLMMDFLIDTSEIG